VRALAIAGPLVAGGVGTHESALPSPERVDLGGRCVIPAFNDAHVHFPTWSLALREVRLEGVRRMSEALERIQGAADGPWIRGSGWRADEWEATPARDALDSVTGSRPAALWSRDRHSLWLNTAALAHAQGDLDAGRGMVERDDRGDPTGILREEAAWSFSDRFLQPTLEELDTATRHGIRLAHARGVAAVHDMDGRLGAGRVFQRIAEHEGLTLRVWQSLPHTALPELVSLGFRSRIGDDFLRIGYLKVFMDGTLGSGTARMLDGSGASITTREELELIVSEAARAGWPVAVHAIGDRANRDTLDAFSATRETWSAHGLRQRVEHAQCLAPEDVGRFAQLGVACSVQFSHATSDRDLADRRWAGLLAGAYAYRSLWDSGALVANGSDAPIEELDPLEGVRAAVRRTLDARPPWHVEQALTVEEALLASTAHPAWLAGDERRRGRLLPGFLADLVVLDRDPLAVAADELDEVAVVATMVGGRWVHNPPPWD
jgi:hypothetical protein